MSVVCSLTGFTLVAVFRWTRRFNSPGKRQRGKNALLIGHVQTIDVTMIKHDALEGCALCGHTLHRSLLCRLFFISYGERNGKAPKRRVRRYVASSHDDRKQFFISIDSNSPKVVLRFLDSQLSSCESPALRRYIYFFDGSSLFCFFFVWYGLVFVEFV